MGLAVHGTAGCHDAGDRLVRPAARRSARVRARADAGRGAGVQPAGAGVFKYHNFFADNLRLLFGLVGWRPDVFTLNVLLPIGISFYTFMAMSYLVDVYRREIQPAERLLDFGVFIA